MAKVHLSDGRTINFSGMPTQADIEEAVVQLDKQKDLSYTRGDSKPNRELSFGNVAGDIVSAINPQAGNMVKTGYGILKKATDPIVSSEQVLKTNFGPVASEGVGTISPMGLPIAQSMPIQTLMQYVPKEIRKQLGAQTISGETSPVALAGTAGMGLEALSEAGVLNKFGKGLRTMAKPITNIAKTGPSYLSEEVAKPAAELVATKLKTQPETAGKLFNLKDDTIAAIKKYGYDRVVDADKAEKEASQAFNIAVNQKTNVHGNKIDIFSTLDKMKRKYNAIKKVDPNNPIKKIIDDLESLRPAPKGFVGEVGPTKSAVPMTKDILKRVQSGESAASIGKEVRISRAELARLRDKLNMMYREGSFDRSVYEIVDSLYSDAEKSGLTGINKARRLFKEYKEISEVSKDALKIAKPTVDKIHSDLLTVTSEPRKYQVMVDKYTPYVGKAEAERMFQEALGQRSGNRTKGIIKYGGTAILGGLGINRLRVPVGQ